VIPPIYATSTYKQDGVGGLRGGYEYSRSANPTRTALEGALAALEEGERGFAFASGLAAEDTILRALTSPGDHVVVPNDAYGGTFRLFEKVEKRWGLDNTPVAISDLESVRAALRPGATRMVWVETPTNPLLNIADIEALASIAHDAGSLLVVDNTFASPYLQQPLALGTDIVVHSTTKYVGGHSDLVGGAVVVRDLDLAEAITFHPERDGCGGRPVRLLPQPPRPQDARGPDGPALRQRRARREVPGLAPQGVDDLLPRSARAPGPPGGRAPDEAFAAMCQLRHADGEQPRSTPVVARRCSHWGVAGRWSRA
jgi:hypothetical protein